MITSNPDILANKVLEKISAEIENMLSNIKIYKKETRRSKKQGKSKDKLIPDIEAQRGSKTHRSRGRDV
jgi:hypothetical protein